MLTRYAAESRPCRGNERTGNALTAGDTAAGREGGVACGTGRWVRDPTTFDQARLGATGGIDRAHVRVRGEIAELLGEARNANRRSLDRILSITRQARLRVPNLSDIRVWTSFSA